MHRFVSFPEAKVTLCLTCKTDPVEFCGESRTKTFFCHYSLTGNFIPYPAGGDICGEDHSENGQDRDQRGMFRYVQPITWNVTNLLLLVRI